MPEAVHRHGALAGVELGHVGIAAGNRAVRLPPIGPSSHLTLESVEPFQCKVMNRKDIRVLRQQHRAAARRAKEADFDIVYAYVGHGLSIFSQFLQTRYNQRNDEYGGRFENRLRLLREVLEDMKEEIGDRCAVAIRFAVNEIDGDLEAGRDAIEALKDLPDLWDVNVSDWTEDSKTSRYAKEGFQEESIAFVKQVTDKPVVSVGRFTSPETMLSQVRRGVLDLVGAARPSIADPFLPQKIDQGREDEIRECIGCNICVSGELSYSPMRCTQNPTTMEEFRRGWHPENFPAKGSDDNVLIIGAGPSGLEAAHVLAKRGYEVTLADARDEPGGRVLRESNLPGLAEWRRVADYRLNYLRQMGNVSLYNDSELGTDDIYEFGASHIVCATGASWRRDGIGRFNAEPVTGHDSAGVISADDVFEGIEVKSPLVIYDEDGTYLANLFTEKFHAENIEIIFVTPHAEVAPYLALTMEQHRVAAGLTGLGIRIERLKMIGEITGNTARFDCIHGGHSITVEYGNLCLLSARKPNDSLYQALCAEEDNWQAAGIKSVSRIGDCEAPGIIAQAVHSGHRYGMELDEPDFEMAYLPMPLGLLPAT